MNITHFIILVEHNYKIKNTLEKDVFEYAKSIDRKIFDHDQFEVVKERIHAKIQELNEKNKRCKPMKTWFTPGYPIKEDIVVHGLNTVHEPLIKIRVATMSHISSL